MRYPDIQSRLKSLGNEGGDLKQALVLKWSDFKWPLLFLLSMSMMGLRFPLGYLLVPVILINRFKKDRYDFLIMLTIFFGGYGLIGEGTLPVKPWDIAFVVSIIGLFVTRKSAIARKAVTALAVYAACLVVLALFSEERMSIQIRTLRNYLFFVYFIVPIMVFAGQKFELKTFFSRLAPYVFIICIFYIIDGLVVNGQIFVPYTFVWGEVEHSTFYSPILFGFGTFPRKYPPGLYLFILFAFAMARYYKLSKWQWAVIILALCSCRTFTVISGIFATYIFCMPNVKKIARYAVIACAAFVALYFVDSMLPATKDGLESPLRISSSINQFVDLSEVEDEEDLANLGSGRMAQVLPKLELVNELGKQATGLGFLHPQLTTNQKYIIINPLYVDEEKAEEVATGIEIEPVQVYVTIGYIGLIFHSLFFVFTYLFISRLKYSFYYISAVFTAFWFGLGGFANLNGPEGLILCGLAFSIVILSHESESSKENAIQ